MGKGRWLLEVQSRDWRACVSCRENKEFGEEVVRESRKNCVFFGRERRQVKGS